MQNFNCNKWGCDGYGFKKWWLAKISQNWWEKVFNYENDTSQVTISFPTPTPTSVPTPSPYQITAGNCQILKTVSECDSPSRDLEDKCAWYFCADKSLPRGTSNEVACPKPTPTPTPNPQKPIIITKYIPSPVPTIVPAETNPFLGGPKKIVQPQPPANNIRWQDWIINLIKKLLGW